MKKLIVLSAMFAICSTLLAQTQVPENTSSPIYYNNGRVGLNRQLPASLLHLYLGSATTHYPTVDSRGDVVQFVECSNNGFEIGNSRGFNARRAWILARHSGSDYMMHYSTFHLQPDVGDKTYYKGIAIGYPASTQLPYGTHLAINGNVGIGTLSPEKKLDVVGAIRAHEIVVSKAKTADFVFEEDYKLRPLEEVEAFVKEHKHLPEVASAREMERDGVKQSKMNQKLLQKIEELTLYMIEVKKIIDKQQREIENLKANQK
jgi:hypothetical protein